MCDGKYAIAVTSFSERLRPRTTAVAQKRHRIEPWCYVHVRDLVLRLHANVLRLDEMLPDRWAAAHPEAVLSHRLDESRAKAARTSRRRAHRRACGRRVATSTSVPRRMARGKETSEAEMTDGSKHRQLTGEQ